MLKQDALIQGRYEIIRLLGSGGFASVYLARDRRLGRLVALKEVEAARLGAAEREAAAELFEREAQMLAQFDHVGLTRVWDYFQDEGRVFLVMEYVPGRTLRDLVKGGPLPEVFVLECGLQLCAVLIYLHTRRPPLIFRDLKPANVMLVEEPGADGADDDRPPSLKLIDFGIARFFKPERTSDTMIIGTPGYAPPEQYGHGQTDERSDIYSLGATLHHLLSGRAPAGMPLPPLTGVAPALARIVARATALDPDARYPSAEALRRDLLACARPLHAGAAHRPGAPDAAAPAASPGPKATIPLPSTGTIAPPSRTVPIFPLALLLGAVLGAVVLFVWLRGPADQGEVGGEALAGATAAVPSAAPVAPPEWILPDAPGRIAFGEREPQGYNVFVAALDGAAPQRATDDAQSYSPAWSPDGRLAVTRGAGIFADMGGGFVQVSPPGVQARYPAWSPDGRRLAYAARNGTGSLWQLAVVDLASGEARTLGPEGVAWITWAPQGLMYAAPGGAGQPQDIFVLGESGAPRNLTNSPDAEEDFPAWSPDGRRVAFVAHALGESGADGRQIYVIDADGGNRTQLTQGLGPHTNPVWSPDGRWIAYLSKAGGGDWQVWAMRADGSQPRQLTFGAQQKFYLAWGK